MTKQVDVAAAVLFRTDGRFLLGRRQGSFYDGYWEFPGGKVEPGETPAQALVRELREELGIDVTHVRPWVVREHHYEHAHVRLHFFEVPGWTGTLRDHVHAALSWELPEAPAVAPMLPANAPILKALCLPRFMAITYAAEIGVEAQLAALERALERGLRLIQVREPGLEANEFSGFCREVIARAHDAGAWVLVNAEPETASAVGADGVHLSSRRLLALKERPHGFEWVGASCHDDRELGHAAALGLDYALLGAVKPTQTHPGQPGMGWDTFAALSRNRALPILALGGVGPADMAQARDAGAHGIAAVRKAWAL